MRKHSACSHNEVVRGFHTANLLLISLLSTGLSGRNRIRKWTVSSTYPLSWGRCLNRHKGAFQHLHQ